MKTSVLITTYNGEKYISEQITSILLQTIKPDEIVICDDKSSDNTNVIIQEFEKKFSAVKVYRNEYNIGYSLNFMNGLSKVSGDFIFLSDQDDIWKSNKIEKVLNFFKKHPNKDLVIHDCFYLVDNKISKETKIQNFISNKISLENYVMGSCVAFRKNLIEKIPKMPDGYMGHDNWIVLFADLINKKSIYNIPLMYYRRHSNNTSFNPTFNLPSLKIISYFKKMIFLFRSNENIFIESNNLKLILDNINENFSINYELLNKLNARKKYLEIRLRVKQENNFFLRIKKAFESRKLYSVKFLISDIFKR